MSSMLFTALELKTSMPWKLHAIRMLHSRYTSYIRIYSTLVILDYVASTTTLCNTAGCIAR